MLAKKMYSHLERENVLPSEQKGCRKGSRQTKDQLLIDKTVLRDCKKRHTNLAMAWIDYKKAYDMVPHSWISECLEMFGIANNVQDFLNNSMKSWKLELNASGKTLGEVDIRRGIFQGDSLSPLLFVLCMVPLTWLLRRAKAGYEWGNKGFKLNHLLFMDDLKLFDKSKNQIDSLVQTVHIFSEDIGMQFGIKKCGVLIMERGKVIRTDGIRLPDGQHIKDIDEIGFAYLAILETDKIKEKEMKEKFSREYLRRLRLILRSKLNGRNKIMAVNTWVASVMRYGAGILRWNTDELKSLDRRNRKFMTMHGALHPKSDIDGVYLCREMGGRGLISCEGCIRMEENNLGWYVRNSVEPLIEGVKAAETIECNDTVNKKEFKQRWMREK